jgi:uncharacterized protein (TIGR04255 family)
MTTRATDWEHFPRAPIVEAVLDLRATLPDGTPVAQLAAFQDSVADEFPKREEQHEIRAQLSVSGARVSTESSRTPRGYRFSSNDGRRIVQARLDGFTLSHLAPYGSWSALRAEAAELWERFVQISSALAVTRIALRYINRIMVPTDVSLQEYFRTEPKVSDTLPQGLVWFNLQLGLEDPESDAMVLLTLRTEAIDEPKGALPIILDIDTFRLGTFDPRSQEIWTILDALRHTKNRAFLGSITEKAKETFR